MAPQGREYFASSPNFGLPVKTPQKKQATIDTLIFNKWDGLQQIQRYASDWDTIIL